MKITRFLAASFLTLASMTANAATIWQPTDVAGTGNVNIIQIEILDLTLNGGTLALFEDTSGMTNGLVLGSGGGIFEFTDNGGGSFKVEAFIGTSSQGFITMNGNEFILGVSWGGGYVGDSSYTQNATDLTSYIIDFSDGSNSGNTLAVDLQPIPLPAAAFLFGSALIGFAGISRRN